jgi:hypothetical protein
MEEAKKTATDLALHLFLHGEDNASGIQQARKDAKTARKVARSQERAALKAQEFKWCLLEKVNDGVEEYEGLLNGVTTVALQDSLEIDASVKQYVAQAATIKTAFEALVAALRTAKTALADVENTGFQLSEILENSDSTAADDERKWLQKNVPNFSMRIREAFGDTGDKKTNPPRQPKQGIADFIHDLADDTFEATVKVVGINESANVPSLTPLSKKLAETMQVLNKDVGDNLAYFQSEKNAAQGALSAAMTNIRVKRAEKYRKEKQYHALRATINYIEEGNCPDDSVLVSETAAKLEKIREKVEQAFS